MDGHGYVRELLARYPSVEAVWRPCEVHGRPEPGRHSDLCIQGMFYAADQGLDLWTYHERMYQAALTDRIDIDDMDALADYVADLLDPEGFRQALRDGVYREKLEQANHYAFVDCGVEVVPSYRMGGRALDAIENVGVPFAALERFLGEHSEG